MLGIDRKWWTLAVIGSGTFMSALDTSIVNVALPIIHKTTGASVATIEWVVLVYLITVSASLLIFGRLADMLGRRRIYMLGQAVFVLGSLLCGLSAGVGMLIGARAVQAVGAAMIFALSPGILIGAFAPEERGRALGMQATMTYLGMSLGPALGGFLTEHYGWPSIFFVNVPVGAMALAVSANALHRDQPGGRQQFDLIGAALMAITLSSLLFALTRGPEWGWHSPIVLGLFGLFVVGLAAFIAVERAVTAPALDLSLFRSRVFSASVLAAYLCYTATAALNFVMPFFLLNAAGFRESQAGLVLMATPIGMMLLTAPSGYLSDRIGVRLPTTIGMAVMATGAAMLLRLHADATPASIMPCTLLFGIGAGLFTAPNNSAIMGAAPAERRGVAGAVLAAGRTCGFASGVAMAGLIYGSRYPSHGIVDATHTALAATAIVCVLASVLSSTRRQARTPA